MGFDFFRMCSWLMTAATVCLAAGVCSSNRLHAEQLIRILVESGKTARQNCPVTVALPENVAELAREWSLWEIRDAEHVPTPHQFVGGKQNVLAWILAGATPPKTIRTFELRPADEPRPDRKSDTQVTVQRSDRTLEIRGGSTCAAVSHGPCRTAGRDGLEIRPQRAHPPRVDAGRRSRQ